MALLRYINTVSSDLFSYKNNKFVAEISELPGFRFSQIYDDACDEGFAIRNPRTGKSVVFVISKIDTDGEDIYGWNFDCITAGYKNLSCLIIND